MKLYLMDRYQEEGRKMFKEPTAKDAAIYMEICFCLLRRLGGEVLIGSDEVPMKEFCIAYRRNDDGDLEVRLRDGNVTN